MVAAARLRSAGTHLAFSSPHGTKRRAERVLATSCDDEPRRARPVALELELGGPLLPGWAGKLASACARRAISLDRGHAVGDRNGLWSARFEIVSALDLRALPLASFLLEDADDSARLPPALASCDVHAAVEHGGSLHVEVTAPDCVGFLAGLMRRFAYFSLFPVELRLDTRSGRVDDQFWLRAGAYRRPSPATGPALRSSLRGLLRAELGAA
jgi:hypothetical protein